MHGKFFYETGLEAPRGVPDGTKEVFSGRAFAEEILGLGSRGGGRGDEHDAASRAVSTTMAKCTE
jgi:hypothetical protein